MLCSPARLLLLAFLVAGNLVSISAAFAGGQQGHAAPPANPVPVLPANQVGCANALAQRYIEDKDGSAWFRFWFGEDADNDLNPTKCVDGINKYFKDSPQQLESFYHSVMPVGSGPTLFTDCLHHPYWKGKIDDTGIRAVIASSYASLTRIRDGVMYHQSRIAGLEQMLNVVPFSREAGRRTSSPLLPATEPYKTKLIADCSPAGPQTFDSVAQEYWEGFQKLIELHETRARFYHRAVKIKQMLQYAKQGDKWYEGPVGRNLSDVQNAGAAGIGTAFDWEWKELANANGPDKAQKMLTDEFADIAHRVAGLQPAIDQILKIYPNLNKEGIKRQILDYAGKRSGFGEPLDPFHVDFFKPGYDSKISYDSPESLEFYPIDIGDPDWRAPERLMYDQEMRNQHLTWEQYGKSRAYPFAQFKQGLRNSFEGDIQTSLTAIDTLTKGSDCITGHYDSEGLNCYKEAVTKAIEIAPPLNPAELLQRTKVGNIENLSAAEILERNSAWEGLSHLEVSDSCRDQVRVQREIGYGIGNSLVTNIALTVATMGIGTLLNGIRLTAESGVLFNGIANTVKAGEIAVNAAKASRAAGIAVELAKHEQALARATLLAKALRGALLTADVANLAYAGKSAYDSCSEALEGRLQGLVEKFDANAAACSNGQEQVEIIHDYHACLVSAAMVIPAALPLAAHVLTKLRGPRAPEKILPRPLTGRFSRYMQEDQLDMLRAANEKAPHDVATPREATPHNNSTSSDNSTPRENSAAHDTPPSEKAPHKSTEADNAHPPSVLVHDSASSGGGLHGPQRGPPPRQGGPYMLDGDGNWIPHERAPHVEAPKAPMTVAESLGTPHGQSALESLTAKMGSASEAKKFLEELLSKAADKAEAMLKLVQKLDAGLFASPGKRNSLMKALLRLDEGQLRFFGELDAARLPSVMGNPRYRDLIDKIRRLLDKGATSAQINARLEAAGRLANTLDEGGVRGLQKVLAKFHDLKDLAQKSGKVLEGAEMERMLEEALKNVNRLSPKPLGDAELAQALACLTQLFAKL